MRKFFYSFIRNSFHSSIIFSVCSNFFILADLAGASSLFTFTFTFTFTFVLVGRVLGAGHGRDLRLLCPGGFSLRRALGGGSKGCAERLQRTALSAAFRLGTWSRSGGRKYARMRWSHFFAGAPPASIPDIVPSPSRCSSTWLASMRSRRSRSYSPSSESGFDRVAVAVAVAVVVVVAVATRRLFILADLAGASALFLAARRLAALGNTLLVSKLVTRKGAKLVIQRGLS
jgi:hypothetical protein